jgi:hypothetical protein
MPCSSMFGVCFCIPELDVSASDLTLRRWRTSRVAKALCTTLCGLLSGRKVRELLIQAEIAGRMTYGPR